MKQKIIDTNQDSRKYMILVSSLDIIPELTIDFNRNKPPKDI